MDIFLLRMTAGMSLYKGLAINTPNNAGLHLRGTPESALLSSRNHDPPAQISYLGSVS